MSNDGIFDSDVWPRAKCQFVRESRKVYWMPGATHVSFLAIGGGGGGGSGRYGITTNAGGASGGSGAQLNYCRRFPKIILESLQHAEYFQVTIGAGGTGGGSVDIDATNGQNGGGGGNTEIIIYANVREGTSQGQNNFRLIANGGGLGAAGNSTTNPTATATANGYGALNGHTGASGSLTGGGQLEFNHSGNSFGTNPFQGSAPSGGGGGNSKGTLSTSWNKTWSKFYMGGTSTPTLAAGAAGRDATERAWFLWKAVEDGHFKEAPLLEDLWWFTGLPGGTGGNGGSTTNRGGRGGHGYLGSGGGGGAGSGATGSGQGGDGGAGIAVFWWEKLQ